MDRLHVELLARQRLGLRPVSLPELNLRLAAIGYALERALDCDATNRQFSGEPYPAINPCIVEADTGISFAHATKARRDSNFDKLQKLRFGAALFAIVRGRILEI